MKKKQAWKVMGAVLAGTLVFSDAVPLHASASAGTEKSAVQNETVSGTENGTETKTKRAAVYVNLKTGDDTADGTTAETAVKTVDHEHISVNRMIGIALFVASSLCVSVPVLREMRQERVKEKST